MGKRKSKSNASIILIILFFVAVIILAIYVGKNKANNSNEQTQNTSNNSVNQNNNNNSQTPVVTQTESPIPAEEPTMSPSLAPDTSNMTPDEKVEYAKSIAKSSWEKVGANIQVSYEYESILSDGRYMIAIRNNATTVDYCYVDIKTGTGELELYK